jgi:hypothetical protein
VEHFALNKDGLWLLKEYSKPKEKLSIETVNFHIQLEEVYERTKL